MTSHEYNSLGVFEKCCGFGQANLVKARQFKQKISIFNIINYQYLSIKMKLCVIELSGDKSIIGKFKEL